MNKPALPFFAPQLFIPNGITSIDFYLNAFGAKELRRFSNEDGSIHVSELSINGAIFHLHEITKKTLFFDPTKHNGTTTLIGLFVEDVDSTIEKAVAAGATLLSAPESFDYGYRQGEIKDSFGHCWLIEKVI